MDAASVKQYYNCGHSYAYIHMWQQFRDTHSKWNPAIHIASHSDSGTNYGDA
ncbi:hypothetical protein [Streptomyces cinereoruber]|uniref:hypothetical protein n=1 Tax=Streptomyces cinereoruber TaxID=67260 RepID=UPI003644BDC7